MNLNHMRDEIVIKGNKVTMRIIKRLPRTVMVETVIQRQTK
jgi:hypothetical protein